MSILLFPSKYDCRYDLLSAPEFPQKLQRHQPDTLPTTQPEVSGIEHQCSYDISGASSSGRLIDEETFTLAHVTSFYFPSQLCS